MAKVFKIALMFYKRIIDFEEKKKIYFFDYTPTQKIKYFAKIYDDLGTLINKSMPASYRDL